jgi:hypothetical protein
MARIIIQGWARATGSGDRVVGGYVFFLRVAHICSSVIPMFLSFRFAVPCVGWGFCVVKYKVNCGLSNINMLTERSLQASADVGRRKNVAWGTPSDSV